DRWMLRDCGTPNGTWLNEVRIQSEAPLQDGAEIAIADVRLRFSLLTEPAARELIREPKQPPAKNTIPRWQGDDLAALHAFTTKAVERQTAPDLVELLLQTIREHSQATAVGFLS